MNVLNFIRRRGPFGAPVFLAPAPLHPEKCASPHPIYKYLKSQTKGFLGSGAIKWNFSKFLISRDGKKIERYAPTVKPEALDAKVAAMLAK